MVWWASSDVLLGWVRFSRFSGWSDGLGGLGAGGARVVVTESAAGARRELLTSQPGGAGKEEVLKESLGRRRSRPSRGCSRRGWRIGRSRADGISLRRPPSRGFPRRVPPSGNGPQAEVRMFAES
ncbi:hypothetical protein GCM10009738_17590 [Kitasatospora viridis]